MTQLVGILNLTPDSFSDGGNYTSAERAIEQADALMEAGADIIDIGAESTRPGAIPLTEAEEWQRLEPVLTVLCNQGLPISLDSYHPGNIIKALDLGIAWVNDVTGFTNPLMLEAISHAPKERELRIVLMHNLGIPANPTKLLPLQEDPVALVFAWAEARIADLTGQGIDKDQIIFDPGIGFGKNATQSLTLIKRIKEFHTLGVELLVGHSRKSCFSVLTNVSPGARDPETYTASVYLAGCGVQFLRVHDVDGNARALKVFSYLGN